MRFFQIPSFAFRTICFFCLLAFASCETDSSQNSNHQGQVSDSTSATPPAKMGAATVEVHIPDSLPSNKINIEIAAGTTVLLGKAMMNLSQLKLETKEYTGMGHLVTAMMGFRNNENSDRYWQFCVNGVVAAKGIDDTELNAGDKIDWHFVLYNELPCKKIGE
jgi:hypothetical protein